MHLTNGHTDEELIDLLKRGNGDAFTDLYNRYGQLMYHFAYNILQDEHECADVVQDVFIGLWNNKAKLSISNTRSYLLSAVKYRLIRSINASKIKAEILATDISLGVHIEQDSLEVKELKQIIATFQESLPPKSREVFKLSRNEYLSNKEIALRLNISEKTVENQMTISLRKLRLTLGRMSAWIFFF